ncbi:unnamed protein product [Pylaiella littoralis]
MSDDGGPDSAVELESRIAELEARLDGTVIASDLDTVWIIMSAVLVFFMQVGFAMLEVGSVSPRNTKAVLLKNIGDASLGAICWWLVGFALAFGKDANGFIGTDMWFLSGTGEAYDSTGMKEAEWVFGWAFAATSVTIVSGAIAERVKIVSYVAYAVFLTSFIYPVVAHWAWHADGWASPYRRAGEGLPLLAGCGAADFAGSSVVHMVGGAAALIATVAVKPRKGRFGRKGQVYRLTQQSPALQTLGTLILWVGWYAFNAGSSVTISDGRSIVAARAVVSTTIGPSAGVVVMVVLVKIMEKKFDTKGVNNAILSGLVAVTAGAPLIEPEGAFVVGVVAAAVYYTSANLLLKLQIDDVVDAAPVHLFCGIWGMIGTGLFTTPEGWVLTYGAAGGDRADECCGLFYGCGFGLLSANLALVCAILAWVGLTGSILFFTIEATVGLRVPANEEVSGMDITRHSVSTTGSFSMAGGAGNGSSHGGGMSWGGKNGMDAVHRALAVANSAAADDSSYSTSRGGGGGGGGGGGVGGGSSAEAAWRSNRSPRAGSLSESRHGDVLINGKHEHVWGWDHNGSTAGSVAAMSTMDQQQQQQQQQQQRVRSTASLFGVPPTQRSPSAAEAVTPSVGRAGSGYGFNGIRMGGAGGGGGGRGGGGNGFSACRVPP